MDKNAQLFSVDTIVALSLFVVILLAVIWSWDSIKERAALIERRNDMEIITRNAFSSLLETPGIPSNWENQSQSWFDTNNVKSLGLSLGIPNFVSKNKIEILQSWNNTKYTMYKELLGILGPGYQFSLKFWLHNGTDFSVNPTYTIGIPSNVTKASQIVVGQRLVHVNKNWSKVQLEVWYE